MACGQNYHEPEASILRTDHEESGFMFTAQHTVGAAAPRQSNWVFRSADIEFGRKFYKRLFAGLFFDGV